MFQVLTAMLFPDRLAWDSALAKLFWRRSGAGLAAEVLAASIRRVLKKRMRSLCTPYQGHTSNCKSLRAPALVPHFSRSPSLLIGWSGSGGHLSDPKCRPIELSAMAEGQPH
jgi:hypothetical protein